ncbi:MAG: MYXO-CTERM sorting domain-containing protein, partial [Polyangiaceae bacterium]
PSARVPPSYSMRVDLPSDVGPGQEVALSLELPAYAVTGAHTVQIDMVQELKTWFEAQGDIPLLSTFNVVVPVTQGGDGGSGATLDGGIGAGPNGAGNALGDGDGEGGCACRSAAPATAGHAGRWAVLGAALLLFRRRKKHANPTDSW